MCIQKFSMEVLCVQVQQTHVDQSESTRMHGSKEHLDFALLRSGPNEDISLKNFLPRHAGVSGRENEAKKIEK